MSRFIDADILMDKLELTIWALDRWANGEPYTSVIKTIRNGSAKALQEALWAWSYDWEANKLKSHMTKGEYMVYLQSPEWKAKRFAVQARAKGMCESCYTAPMAVVHHLTYRRVGKELLSDLLGVCDTCHGRFHRRKDAIVGENK